MVQGNIIIFVIVTFIISALSYIFKPKKSLNKVPKRIWTYWDGSDKTPIPRSVKLCMESWATYNPGYEITLLTRKNFQGYVTIPEEIRTHPHFNDSSARFSDLIRLYVLEEHGGIWIDASVLVKAAFDDWLFTKPAEFAGYYMKSYTVNPAFPVIESWFLAANKNSSFIQKWKEEFIEVTTFKDIPAYLDSRRKMGINFSEIRDPHYLAVYVAALKVIEYDKYPQDTLILRNSEDGPFRYLKDSQWYPEKAMKLACQKREYQTPIMKMRSDERKILDRELDYDLSLEACGWL